MHCPAYRFFTLSPTQPKPPTRLLWYWILLLWIPKPARLTTPMNGLEKRWYTTTHTLPSIPSSATSRVKYGWHTSHPMMESPMAQREEPPLRFPIPHRKPKISLSPDPASTQDDLICSVDTPSTDADGDSVVYTYVWTDDSNCTANNLSNDCLDRHISSLQAQVKAHGHVKSHPTMAQTTAHLHRLLSL